MELVGILFGVIFWPIVWIVWIRACKVGRIRKGFRYVGHTVIFGFPILAVLSLSYNCIVQEPFYEAACAGDATRVQQLLKWGANPNIDFEGSYPLVEASEEGHAKVVRILLDAGADPNAGLNSGESAIHVARANKHWDIVRILRKAGAAE